MDEQLYITKLIPHIRKYLKKHPVTGTVEREEWFQFKYRVTGVTYKEDYYSWNRRFYVNIEVSDKYWSYRSASRTYEWLNTGYYWSSKRRNQYIRTYVGENLKTTFDLFSIPTRIEIGKIKMVD